MLILFLLFDQCEIRFCNVTQQENVQRTEKGTPKIGGHQHLQLAKEAKRYTSFHKIVCTRLNIKSLFHFYDVNAF